jgi:hypothetical protein
MPTNFLPTRDFYLASFLIASTVKLQSHNKINGTTIFNFPNDDKTNDAINSYYSMSATIEPISYGNAIKSLKSIVHSYDKENTNTEEINNVKKTNRIRR